MRSMIAVVIVLFATLFSLAGVPACAGKMEGGKDMMMEKGDAMSKDGSMTEPEKAMMKESSGAMYDGEGEPSESADGKTRWLRRSPCNWYGGDHD